jgi:hypothetical protein
VARQETRISAHAAGIGRRMSDPLAWLLRAAAISVCHDALNIAEQIEL